MSALPLPSNNGSDSPSGPLVSMILTTRDRPGFLPLALRCYGHQNYPFRELIVVDDGASHPVNHSAVDAVGGRLVRMPSGTPIGAKLNRGIDEARGAWCQKMDDDDWYSPGFLQSMVSAVTASRLELCRPLVAFLAPFLFFDLASWEIRCSVPNNFPGATFFFAREDGKTARFVP